MLYYCILWIHCRLQVNRVKPLKDYNFWLAPVHTLIKRFTTHAFTWAHAQNKKVDVGNLVDVRFIFFIGVHLPPYFHRPSFTIIFSNARPQSLELYHAFTPNMPKIVKRADKTANTLNCNKAKTKKVITNAIKSYVSYWTSSVLVFYVFFILQKTWRYLPIPLKQKSKTT